MKNRRPGRGGGAETVTKAAFADSYTAYRRPLQALHPDLTFRTPLDEATLAVLRRTWWRLRRHHGVRLPAERGVILIDGHRP